MQSPIQMYISKMTMMTKTVNELERLVRTDLLILHDGSLQDFPAESR